MFIAPGTEVYEGMIVGEHRYDFDLAVNVTQKKNLTNVRSSTKDNTVVLKTPRKMHRADRREQKIFRPFDGTVFRRLPQGMGQPHRLRLAAVFREGAPEGLEVEGIFVSLWHELSANCLEDGAVCGFSPQALAVSTAI